MILEKFLDECIQTSFFICDLSKEDRNVNFSKREKIEEYRREKT